jgi:hypothetical protein
MPDNDYDTDTDTDNDYDNDYDYDYDDYDYDYDFGPRSFCPLGSGGPGGGRADLKLTCKSLISVERKNASSAALGPPAALSGWPAALPALRASKPATHSVWRGKDAGWKDYLADLGTAPWSPC